MGERIPPKAHTASDKEKEKQPGRLSRRAVLVGAAALGVSGVTYTGGPTIRDALEGVVDGKAMQERIESLKNNIKKEYDIDVHFDDSVWKNMDTESSWLAEQARMLEWVGDDLARYPRSMLKSYSPVSLTLRDALYFKNQKDRYFGGSLEGVTESAPGTAADVIVEVGGKFANRYHHFGWTTKEDFINNYNHEFFHAIDPIDDAYWKEQFPRTFNSFPVENDAEVSGYAMGYGLVSPKEDRATIYAQFATGDHRFMERCTTDGVLAEKVHVISEYLTLISQGLLDDEYWTIRNQPDFSLKAAEYFKRQSERIAKEPLSEFHSRHPFLRNVVTEKEYTAWQQELAAFYSQGTK